MAQYGILVYLPAPADPMDLSPEEADAHDRYAAQVEELGGRIISGYALEPSTAAKTVRGGVASDGPVMDSHEVLTGTYVLEARDMDHAVQIAMKDPSTLRGAVEVRPLFVPPAE